MLDVEYSLAKAISQLPPGVAGLAGTELVPVVQDGETRRFPASAFAASIALANNLTTDDANRALTAAMGKQLYDLLQSFQVSQQPPLSLGTPRGLSMNTLNGQRILSLGAASMTEDGALTREDFARFSAKASYDGVLDEYIYDRVSDIFQQGSNVTITKDDLTNRLTVNASGSGSGPSAIFDPEYFTLNGNEWTLNDLPQVKVTGLTESLNNKVDKIIGKGLSTIDFTEAYRSKLDMLQTTGSGTTFLASDGTYKSIGGGGGGTVLTDGTDAKQALMWDVATSSWKPKIPSYLQLADLPEIVTLTGVIQFNPSGVTAFTPLAVTTPAIADEAITEPKLAITGTPDANKVIGYASGSLAWVTAPTGSGGLPAGTSTNQYAGWNGSAAVFRQIQYSELGGLPSVVTMSGDVTFAADGVTTIGPGKVDTGKLANASVTIPKIGASGTPSATTFLRGDGQWATPPSGGGAGGATTLDGLTDVEAPVATESDILQYRSNGLWSNAPYLDIRSGNVPANPNSATYRLFATQLGGLTEIHFKSASGYEGNPFQDTTIHCTNNSGGALTKGQVVTVVGGSGNLFGLPVVTLARANSASTCQLVLMAMQDVAVGATARFAMHGKIYNINTSAFPLGSDVYVSPTTAGGLTATRPTGTNVIVYVGKVTNSHTTEGVIAFNISAYQDQPGTGGGTSYTDAQALAAIGAKLTNTQAVNLSYNTSNSQITGTLNYSNNAAGTISFQQDAAGIYASLKTAERSALLNRANHTGTQPASTITGLAVVATTGSYSDLSGTPAFPIVDQTLQDGSSNAVSGNAVYDAIGGLQNLITSENSSVVAAINQLSTQAQLTPEGAVTVIPNSKYKKAPITYLGTRYYVLLQEQIDAEITPEFTKTDINLSILNPDFDAPQGQGSYFVDHVAGNNFSMAGSGTSSVVRRGDGAVGLQFNGTQSIVSVNAGVWKFLHDGSTNWSVYWEGVIYGGQTGFKGLWGSDNFTGSVPGVTCVFNPATNGIEFFIANPSNPAGEVVYLTAPGVITPGETSGIWVVFRPAGNGGLHHVRVYVNYELVLIGNVPSGRAYSSSNPSYALSVGSGGNLYGPVSGVISRFKVYNIAVDQEIQFHQWKEGKISKRTANKGKNLVPKVITEFSSDYCLGGVFCKNPVNGKSVFLYNKQDDHYGSAPGGIVMKTSVDDFETPSKEIPVFVSSDNTQMYAQPVAEYTSNGRLHMIYCRRNGATNFHYTRLCYRYSTNDGSTWSSEVVIATCPNNETFIPIAKIVIMPDGAILCPYYRTTIPGVTNTGVYVARSADGGTTWNATYGTMFSSPTVYNNECTIASLGGQNLVGMMRQEATAGFLQVFSSDGGATWTQQGSVTHGDVWTDIVNGIQTSKTPPHLTSFFIGATRVICSFYFNRNSRRYSAIYTKASDLVSNGAAAWNGKTVFTVDLQPSRGDSTYMGGYPAMDHLNDTIEMVMCGFHESEYLDWSTQVLAKTGNEHLTKVKAELGIA